ncbi:Delta(6)-protoilludene synthase [Leucoagaricus sp. SymC.cos]|nr:Delta(6)-protoilludene synthase [Leucoagaricus sp. SymC.cos]
MHNHTTLQFVTLPTILTNWPWPRKLSEYYQDAGAESAAWVESFHPFHGRSIEAFRKCDFSLLASLTYSPREKSLSSLFPSTSHYVLIFCPAIIRLAWDLMHLFFVFDEYTDVEDKRGAQAVHQVIREILANPEEPSQQKDACVSAIARDFWLRARASVPAGASCIRHFVDAWTSYTAAVIEEADDRANKRYRSFEDYMRIRKNTAGGAPTLALTEFGLDLPDEVFDHPIVASLRDRAETLIVLVNDIYSFIMEKSRGLAIHNGVEIVMRERNISIQEAMDWLGNYCNELAGSFLIEFESLPSWGPDVDARVAKYVNGLGQWVRGIDDWHFESARYFGSAGPVIKQTRIAGLAPPSRGYVSRCSRRGSTYDTM